jgi:hypothetical protein
MANIRIDINTEPTDGQSVTFQAPCDCSAITGLKVYYPNGSNGKASKSFTMKDTHRNTLTSLGNLFSKNAYVHAILDTKNGYAYLQNADTNAYLEGKFNSTIELVNKLADLFSSIHVWQKYTGTAEYSIVETEVTNVEISHYNPGAVDTWDKMDYADEYRLVSGKIELINPTTVTISTSADGTPVLGKYAYSKHTGAYYRVPADAKFVYTDPTYGTHEYITLSKATKLTVNITELDGGEYLGYVYSTNGSEYPENGNADGYLYYYLGTVDKALNR